MQYISVDKFCEIYLENMHNSVLNKAVYSGKSDLPKIHKIKNKNHFVFDEILDWFGSQGNQHFTNAEVAKMRILEWRKHYEKNRVDKTDYAPRRSKHEDTESYHAGWTVPAPSDCIALTNQIWLAFTRRRLVAE